MITIRVLWHEVPISNYYAFTFSTPCPQQYIKTHSTQTVLKRHLSNLLRSFAPLPWLDGALISKGSRDGMMTIRPVSVFRKAGLISGISLPAAR